MPKKTEVRWRWSQNEFCDLIGGYRLTQVLLIFRGSFRSAELVGWNEFLVDAVATGGVALKEDRNPYEKESTRYSRRLTAMLRLFAKHGILRCKTRKPLQY